MDNYEQLIINKIHSAMIEAGLTEAAEVYLLNHALGVAGVWPDPEPAKIIEYHGSRIDEKTPSELLVDVYYWDSTPQGSEYWDYVYNALIKWEEQRK